MEPGWLIVLLSHSRPALPPPEHLLGTKNDPLYFLCILYYRVHSTYGIYMRGIIPNTLHGIQHMKTI